MIPTGRHTPTITTWIEWYESELAVKVTGAITVGNGTNAPDEKTVVYPLTVTRVDNNHEITHLLPDGTYELLEHELYDSLEKLHR